MDPLQFADGLRFTWRCGDNVNAQTVSATLLSIMRDILLMLQCVLQGLKCYTEDVGNTVGTPTCDNVKSYAWVYHWPSSVSH